MSRVRGSFGKMHFNPGTETVPSPIKYELDNTRRFYLFDIIPMGAVRMSSSDRWKTNPLHPDKDKRQRSVVTQYFGYKDSLRKQGLMLDFVLEGALDVVFILPMPDSWSGKKKERMNAMPCETKPDIDNLVKGLMDAFKKEDGNVWSIKAEKRWGFAGSIIIFR